MPRIAFLSATSELSCQCVYESAIAFPNSMPHIAVLSATSEHSCHCGLARPAAPARTHPETARPTHPTFAPTHTRFYCKTQHFAPNLTFRPSFSVVKPQQVDLHCLHIPLVPFATSHPLSLTSRLFHFPFLSNPCSSLRNTEVSSKLPLINCCVASVFCSLKLD